MRDRKIRELTALYEVARLVASTLDLEAPLAAILGALADVAVVYAGGRVASYGTPASALPD